MNTYQTSTKYFKGNLVICLLLSAILIASCSPQETATPTQDLPAPTQEPTQVEPTAAPVIPTATVAPPTDIPVVGPPDGFKEYQDSKIGISIYIPESWNETNQVEGQSVVLISYPIDKYDGGELLEPGDTKCDLSIQQEGESLGNLVEMWRASDMMEIVSQQDIILNSGQIGQRFEIDSMGRSNVMAAEIAGRVVLLTCFGDFTRFDDIAGTLAASE